VKSRLCSRNKTKRLKTIKIDVFDKIDDLLHIDTFKQLFHCKDGLITSTAVIKSSTFEQKMLYSNFDQADWAALLNGVRFSTHTKTFLLTKLSSPLLQQWHNVKNSGIK